MNREIKFASMVEKYMRMNGLTMKELGEKVGRGESTVSMWIANKLNFSSDFFTSFYLIIKYI